MEPPEYGEVFLIVYIKLQHSHRPHRHSKYCLKSLFPPPHNFKQVFNSSFIGVEQKDATSQPTIQPDLPVLASTGKQSFTGMHLLSSSHPQISASDGGSSCSFCVPTTSLSENPFPSTKCKRTARHPKARRQRRRERGEGKEFKFRYLLTETQKRTHIQAPLLAEIPAVRAVELCFQQGFLCLKLHRSLLSLSQERTEECSALPAPVYLSFNASGIH